MNLRSTTTAMLQQLLNIVQVITTSRKMTGVTVL